MDKNRIETIKGIIGIFLGLSALVIWIPTFENEYLMLLKFCFFIAQFFIFAYAHCLVYNKCWYIASLITLSASNFLNCIIFAIIPFSSDKNDYSGQNIFLGYDFVMEIYLYVLLPLLILYFSIILIECLFSYNKRYRKKAVD